MGFVRNRRWIIQGLKGHVWETSEDTGGIDFMASSFGTCNGPRCVNCGYSFCEHCVDDEGDITPCPNSMTIPSE